MQPLVAQRLAEVRELCRRFRVRRLDLFSSAARDDFDPARSDLDFLVEYEADAPSGLAGYVGFKEELEALFGRPVDLVEASAVLNPYLLASIERSRETVYAA
jgi:predicted nucleotidyltransferase